jgi:hypothetical protein
MSLSVGLGHKHTKTKLSSLKQIVLIKKSYPDGIAFFCQGFEGLLSSALAYAFAHRPIIFNNRSKVHGIGNTEILGFFL